MLENKLNEEGYFTVTTMDPDPIPPNVLDALTRLVNHRVLGLLSPTSYGDKTKDSRRLVRRVERVEENGHGNLFRTELTGEYKPNGTTETCLVTIHKSPIRLEGYPDGTHYQLEVRVEGTSSNYKPIILGGLGKIYHDLFERRNPNFSKNY